MIINSIIDSDLYKFSMQYFVLVHYPETEVEYQFNNRDKSMKFTKEAFEILKQEIQMMKKLRLTDDEYEYIKANIKFLPPMYRQYLSNFRFNPDQINMVLLENGQLDITIKGKWRETILWEVPLMALISEIYFKYCDTDWVFDTDEQKQRAIAKAFALTSAGCKYTDFGTRRRRSYATQDIVVATMAEFNDLGFVGTSNVHLAMKYGIKAIGTLAHEMIQAVSALESMNHPNKYAMEKWAEVYKANLGTYLPDTYGLDSFFKDFDYEKANYWQSLRHDSGCPFQFVDRVLEHYKKLKINPMVKTLIFSDGLDVETAVNIKEYCEGKIPCSFGIGTFFVNDYKRTDGTKSKAMNMVIKIVLVDGVNVCKLSCVPTKAIGHPDAIKMMKHIHNGEPL